ncbi:MAG: methyltransferase [Hyphomicrobiales bacterium]|nr:MAG: methyltransferase [Hyphomicrobiales bacterium]
MPTPKAIPSLKQRIIEEISQNGPMPLSRYMNLCLGDPHEGYYMTRDPFGMAGDFTTAPEVSQMFGELIGIWAIEAWKAIGAPTKTRLVEFGPGRGTLMADCLRSLSLEPKLISGLEVQMIEMSPTLVAAQQKRLVDAPCPVSWHGTLPDCSLPTLMIANEFFDALPVHILTKTETGYAQRHITAQDDDTLVFADIPASLPTGFPEPDHIQTGTVFELSPERYQYAQTMAATLKANTGAALIIDYGFEQPKTGATFQALQAHQPVDPLENPGSADLTSLVDFTSVRHAFTDHQITLSPTTTQMDFLLNLGLLERAGVLGSTANEAGQIELQAAVNRLVSPDEMGTLFKVISASTSQ